MMFDMLLLLFVIPRQQAVIVQRVAGAEITVTRAPEAGIKVDQAVPIKRPHVLRNASRSAMSWSLCVAARPQDAPA
jgi:hypothetical protein